MTPTPQTEHGIDGQVSAGTQSPKVRRLKFTREFWHLLAAWT